MELNWEYELNNYELEKSDSIYDYLEKRLRYLIWLADQAQKDGDYALMAEIDAEIERIRRRLRLLYGYNEYPKNTLSR